MTTSRTASASEITALQEVLAQMLPKTHQEDLTATAIECAKAVKAAFDVLLADPTQAKTDHSSSTPA